MKSPALVAVTAASLLLLTACTVPTPEEGPFLSATNSPVEKPVVTPIPIEPEVTLILRATVTASDGEKLSLKMQVNGAVPFDDVRAQTVPAAVVADCPGELTVESIAAEQWGFTRASVTAIPVGDSGGSWPAADTIGLLPSADFVRISGRGDVIDSADSSDASLSPCMLDKVLPGPSQGGIGVGLPGDVGAGFTGWVNHTWGFVVTSGKLSDCSDEITALGTALGAGTESWTTVTSPQQCSAGTTNESQAF